MFDLYELFEGAAPKLTIVDVGAASMGKGTDPYHSLSGRPNVNIVGFEPNETECNKRNAEANSNQIFLPHFIGDGKRHRFYNCANPLTSSLYEPNRALLAKFQRLDLPVVEIINVDTSRLDDLAEIDSCDFLKLDIQGAELDAINGAEVLLKNTLVVHTEVEFIPIYKSQPLFGDVDCRLREMGFLLHKFDGIFGRQMKPIVMNDDPFSPLSQILFAEAAVYVKNFMEFNALSPEKLIKLAIILHFVYGSFDLCALALESADKQTGSDFQKRYIERISTPHQ